MQAKELPYGKVVLRRSPQAACSYKCAKAAFAVEDLATDINNNSYRQRPSGQSVALRLLSALINEALHREWPNEVKTLLIPNR